MKRKFLAAAVAISPLLIAIAGQAQAQDTINSSTSTPVSTATANGGQPEDIVITSAGSVGPSAAGAAVTLNSNNSVSNAGSISFSGVNGATGVLIEGGNTGTFTNTGSISVTESYSAPADTNNDGLANGVWAQGDDRAGILVTGTSPFVGNLYQTGTVTVQGNSSQGVSIQAPVTGNFVMETATPEPVTSATTVTPGSISITGDNTVGFQVTPTGSISGNVGLTTVTARGIGAQAVDIEGNVGGSLNISGSVSASGFRGSSRAINQIISQLYSTQELELGGAAATIGGSIGGGVIVSAPPPTLSTTNLDLDGDGIPDSLQGTGTIASYGSAPALQIGNSASSPITLGAYTGSTVIRPDGNNATQNYSLVIQGTVAANGLFDQLTSPYLPAPVSATALQIGGQILITPEVYVNPTTDATLTNPTPAVYGASGSVILTNGLYNSGSITATAYQADATAIHIGSGGNVSTIDNDGTIAAYSTQVNSATAPVTVASGYPVTPTPAQVNVTAIQIDGTAVVPIINNYSGIGAELTGTGGVGGSVSAIVDKSGTLATINNYGSISAVAVQTLSSAPMPTSGVTASGVTTSGTTAIDMSNGTGAQFINQNVSGDAAASTAYNSANSYTVGTVVSYLGNVYKNVAAAGAAYDPVDYPTYWREIGALSPSITGDIYFGTGADTLNIQAGTVSSGVISMGNAANTITVGSAANSATVTGAISEGSTGSFAINVVNGTLSDTNAATGQGASSINVGTTSTTGTLIVGVNPSTYTAGQAVFQTTGASTFASGAVLGVTLKTLQLDPTEVYTVVQTSGSGTITAGTFGASSVNSPFLYTATPSLANNGTEVNITVVRKSEDDLGFNPAEISAYNAIFQALPHNTLIQGDILAQTTQSGLKAVYDQLLPNQGQGIFEALDAAVQKVSTMTGTTPDAGSRVAGTSLWLQEVNERVDRSGIDTLGSQAQLFGLVGGYEHMGVAGGALGMTLSYLNDQETVDNAAPGDHEVASMVEGGVYYRRAVGHLTVSARGAGGYSWFSSDRRYLSSDTSETAQAHWDGYFYDAHAGASYEVKFGRFYARPQVSFDYLNLKEFAEKEMGGGTGFDLYIDPRRSTRASGEAIMTVGGQWGTSAWLRPEVRFGYREVISGEVGDTTAYFTDVSNSAFTLNPDNDKGGWYTVGFSIKGGTEYSYVALEGDADFRVGQQRYDLRIAGRSMF